MFAIQKNFQEKEAPTIKGTKKDQKQTATRKKYGTTYFLRYLTGTPNQLMI